MPAPSDPADPGYPDLDALRTAIEAAIEARDYAAGYRSIRPVVANMIHERGDEFREFITRLPRDFWQSSPLVCAALGGSYRSAGSRGGPAAIGYYRAAAIALDEADGRYGTNARAAVATGHAAALRSQGLLNDAVAQLEIATAQLINAPGTPDYLEYTARLALESGMVGIDLGHFDDASQSLRYSRGLSEHLTRSENLQCLGGLAMIAYTQGELDEIDVLVGEAEDMHLPEHVLGSGFGAPLLAARLLGTIDRHQFDDARELLGRLESAAAGTDWAPFVLIAAAFAKALARSPIEALDLLNRARQEYRSWRPASFASDVGEVLRAELLASLDSGNEAFTILSELDPGERHSLCPARYIAQQRLAMGDLVGAHKALQACDELGEMHSPRTKMAVQLLRGAIEFERGNQSASDVNVDRALLTMARTGVRSPLRHVPAALLARLASRALGRAQSPEVTEILHHVVASTLGSTRVSDPLSERERLVLTYVERELTVAAIAAELFISPNTVKTHLRRLYQKLGVGTREEAIRAARSLGLHFEPGEQITP